MQILDDIMRRRSIRRFKDDQVPEDKLQILLKAAFAAPTAANCEPWEFVVVDDEAVLEKLRTKMVFGPYVAPLAIVVCGNMDLAFKGPGKDMWVQDCSAATENILIAAANIGLGAVWIGIHPLESNERIVRQILNIPDHVVPLNVLYVGYPDEVKEARTRYNEKRIYRNQYDQERKHRKKHKPRVGHY